jgi:hypothetical protein
MKAILLYKNGFSKVVNFTKNDIPREWHVPWVDDVEMKSINDPTDSLRPRVQIVVFFFKRQFVDENDEQVLIYEYKYTK